MTRWPALQDRPQGEGVSAVEAVSAVVVEHGQAIRHTLWTRRRVGGDQFAADGAAHEFGELDPVDHAACGEIERPLSVIGDLDGAGQGAACRLRDRSVFDHRRHDRGCVGA
jgi:hypothetical protein